MTSISTLSLSDSHAQDLSENEKALSTIANKSITKLQDSELFVRLSLSKLSCN